MKGLSGWQLQGYSKSALQSINNTITAVVKLQGHVIKLEEAMKSTSYNHHASKSKSLTNFGNTLANLKMNLEASKTNIYSTLEQNGFNQYIANSRAEIEAVSRQQKYENEAFRDANPHYFNGGMIKES